MRGNRLTHRVHSPAGRWKINAIVLGGLSVLAILGGASAQDARSPDELVAQVAAAISSAKPERIAALFDSDSESDSEAVQDLVDRFRAFKGSEQFNVKAVGKRDGNWPRRRWSTPGGLEGVVQNFSTLVFPVEPLGRVSISGKKPGAPAGCIVSVLYGKFGDRYLMMLGKERTGIKGSLLPREGLGAPRC